VASVCCAVSGLVARVPEITRLADSAMVSNRNGQITLPSLAKEARLH